VRAETVVREPARVETYAPQSPFANTEGKVAVPNVDVTEELFVAKQAEQAYKAAASILRYSSEMDDTLLSAVDKSA
jgi:flagellar basal-body rod protein FlgC